MMTCVARCLDAPQITGDSKSKPLVISSHTDSNHFTADIPQSEVAATNVHESGKQLGEASGRNFLGIVMLHCCAE